MSASWHVAESCSRGSHSDRSLVIPVGYRPVVTTPRQGAREGQAAVAALPLPEDRAVFGARRRAACWKVESARLGSLTARQPGLLGPIRWELGCATHSGGGRGLCRAWAGALEPPPACAKVAHLSAFNICQRSVSTLRPSVPTRSGWRSRPRPSSPRWTSSRRTRTSRRLGSCYLVITPPHTHHHCTCGPRAAPSGWCPAEAAVRAFTAALDYRVTT